jgi:2-isopropylmalate synthase
VAWVLEQDRGLKLPRRMQGDFSRVVQQLADESSRELNAADIGGAFDRAYHVGGGGRFELVDYHEAFGQASARDRGNKERRFVGRIRLAGEERSISGRGNGLISSVLDALAEVGVQLEVADYHEHALGAGTDAQAAAYVEARTADGRLVYGVGIDADVATAGVKAVLSAANGAG